MKSLKTYIEQIDDPIRQQMLRFLKSEVLLDRNVFNETLDLENDCLYKGQRELAIYVAEKILKEDGLELVIENETEEMDKDNIVVKEQTPKAGITVNKESRISIKY